MQQAAAQLEGSIRNGDEQPDALDKAMDAFDSQNAATCIQDMRQYLETHSP